MRSALSTRVTLSINIYFVHEEKLHTLSTISIRDTLTRNILYDTECFVFFDAGHLYNVFIFYRQVS